MMRDRLRAGKEHPTRYRERYGISEIPRPEGTVIWIHGASVGESLSALPILHWFRQHAPDTTLLMTSGTVTSAEILKKRAGDMILHQFIPWDHPKWTQRFMGHWKPDAVIWLESELWPNHLRLIDKAKIPALLMNGRLSQTSFDRWRKWAPKLAKGLLDGFEHILAQTYRDQARFEDLSDRSIPLMPNLKYASDQLPVRVTDLDGLMAQIGDRRVLVLASSHPNEEDMLIESLEPYWDQLDNWLIVIVPRHPARGNEIMTSLLKRGKTVGLRSRGDSPTVAYKIYIADTLGELGLWFSVSDLTLMGGSWIEHGGHNPIEPAHFANPIILGPYMFNFSRIEQDMLEAQTVIKLSNLDEVAGFLVHEADAHSQAGQQNSHNQNMHNMGKRAKEFVRSRRLATMKALEPYLSALIPS